MSRRWIVELVHQSTSVATAPLELPEKCDEKYQCSGYYQYDGRRLYFPFQEVAVIVDIDQYQYSGNQYSESRDLFATKMEQMLISHIFIGFSLLCARISESRSSMDSRQSSAAT